jgi:hypothetical protein
LAEQNPFSMKPLYLLIAWTFCFQDGAFSQTYSTLTSGNWNNTTNVWSLNGSTPCGCFPGNNLVGDTLVVSHPLNLTAHVNASATSKIQVGSSGSMSNALFDITISNSIFLAEGNMNIKKLIINAGGVFQLTNSILMINASSDIYGQLQSNNADIQFLTGNLQVFPSGSVFLSNGTHMHFSNGGYRNDGLTSLCSSCCISSDKGSFQNSAGAVVSGSGAIQVNNGTLKNFGTWPSATTWCASGADVGMSSPENCSLSNQICTFGPLATDLITFEGAFHSSCLRLVWVTSNYLPPLQFFVEYLSPSFSWKKIEGTITYEELESEVHYEMFTDCTLHADGIFKLTALDQEGIRVFEAQTSVNGEENRSARLYPNPSNSNTTLLWTPFMGVEQIEVQDFLGRTILQLEVGGMLTTQLSPPDFPGIYRIILEGRQQTEIRWVVL